MHLEALERLLSEDAQARRASERLVFDQLADGRDLVLMGAGGLGRRTLAGLRRHGVEPLAFADNAAARQGTAVDGIPVLSPETAAHQFRGRAVFVVTIWGANRPHRFAHSCAQLHALGCDLVSSFPPLFWKYPDSLLPFYLQDLPSRVLEQRSAVLRAFDLWEDDGSRAEYVSQVRLRLMADFDGLSHPVTHPQYFPPDLFAWRPDEWIVDGGAYDGDTVRTLVAVHGNRFAHVLALEPDPVNFEKLQTTVAALPPNVRDLCRCCQVALGSEHGTLYLDSTGTAASATTVAATAGTVAVPAEPLDALVVDHKPTFVKLDIEGFEMVALEGARSTILQHAPVLAVCAYHQQNHLWKIPLLLHAWRRDYAFFLRPHNEEGWDLVCYAIPRARLSGQAA